MNKKLIFISISLVGILILPTLSLGQTQTPSLSQIDCSRYANTQERLICTYLNTLIQLYNLLIQRLQTSTTSQISNQSNQQTSYTPPVLNNQQVVQGGIVYYVSPNGNDNNPGTIDRPFKTLEKARDVVRQINQNMNSDIIIYLRGGFYNLDKTFVLDSRDSGTNGYYIIYKNYPGENPVIMSGYEITRWTQDGNKWKAYLGANLDIRHLYINGERAIRARSSGWIPGIQPKRLGGPRIAKDFGYITTDLNMQNWKNQSDIEIVSQYSWQLFRCPVDYIRGNEIHMKSNCWSKVNNSSFPGGEGMDVPYHAHWLQWIENAYELLDSPGEWYYDKTSGWIYYIPKPGEDMTKAYGVVPRLEILVQGKGTKDSPLKNVKFEGLTFAYSTWLTPNKEGFPVIIANVYVGLNNAPLYITSAVNFEYVRNIVFQRNIFSKLGGDALAFYDGAQDVKIIGNHFEDISATAITIGTLSYPNTTDEGLIVKNIEIANNFIKNISTEYKSPNAIFVTFTQKVHIHNNEIDDVPSGGISMGWGWGFWMPKVVKDNLIEKNLISNYLTTLTEDGAISTLDEQPGLIIRENVIRNYARRLDDPYNGSIIFDDGTRFVRAERNVIFAPTNQIGYKGGDNVIVNNWWMNQGWQYPNGFNLIQGCPFLKQRFGYDCGPNIVRDNYVISSESEAPASIVNSAGIESSFRDIKTIPSGLFINKNLNLIPPEQPTEPSQPVITSISPNPATIGQTITVTGRNLKGFEGDKTLIIENSLGQKGIIYDESGSTQDGIIKFTLKDTYCTRDISYSGLPCPSYINITPGTYYIYTQPWGRISNKLEFRVISPSNQPSITVLSPNGGETFDTGKDILVRFSKTNLSPDSQLSLLVRLRNTQTNTEYALININTKDTEFTVNIPPNIPSGSYVLELKGYYANVLLFDKSDAPFRVNQIISTPSAPVPKPRDAQFVSQNVPTKMIAGRNYTVSITMKNKGQESWTEGNLFRLGSQNPQDNSIWGTGRVLLVYNEVIAPGQTKTFNFVVTAPTRLGKHNFQWRMVKDGVEWFGEFTPNVEIEVSNEQNTPTPQLSINKTNFILTDNWELNLRGAPPNQQVYICLIHNNGNPYCNTAQFYGGLATTDSNGNWSLGGNWNNNESVLGEWREWMVVGGTLVNNQVIIGGVSSNEIQFTVSRSQSSMLESLNQMANILNSLNSFLNYLR